jgi:hypothetical protein
MIAFDIRVKINIKILDIKFSETIFNWFLIVIYGLFNIDGAKLIFMTLQISF